MRWLKVLVFGTGALISGCGEGESPRPLPDDVCASQHEEETAGGHTVVVCDELYEEAPYVRLPASSGEHAYAGLFQDPAERRQFFLTTDGSKYGVALSSAETSAEFTRHGVAIYEITLDGNDVSEFRPVLVFHEAEFIRPLLGRVFDGHISRLTEQGYEDQPTLPIRVEIESEIASEAAMSGEVTARAAITNLEKSLSAADGTCMPSVASWGAESPLSDGDLMLTIHRATSMHDFGEDHLVVTYMNADGSSSGSTMGLEWYLTPIDLVRGTLSRDEAYLGHGHGNPTAIPSIELAPAAGGGETCEAP